MPLYEYRCGCGAAEEVIEAFSAPSEHACAACGAPAGMRRQVSKTGFILAGGGWYASGYGEGGSSSAVGKDTGDPAPSKAEPAASGGPCGGGCACH
jgi:putative FmdB family regulatory protein